MQPKHPATTENQKIIGRNIRPGVTPGGFTDQFTGNSREQSRSRKPGLRTIVSDAANRVLEHRVELPGGGL